MADEVLEGDAVSVTRMIAFSSGERLVAPTSAPTRLPSDVTGPPAAGHRPAPPAPNASRLSGRVSDKAWEVLTSVKDTLLNQADKTVIASDELMDQRARALSVKSWTKEQQAQLEEGLKKHTGQELTPAVWDEVAASVEGKTGVECFDRYCMVVAALKKRGDARPPPPVEPAKQPAPPAGIAGIFSSLFGAVKHAVSAPYFADETLEAAAQAPAVSVFNTVAPAVFRLSDPLSSVTAAVAKGSPVLLWDAAAQKWAGQVTVASLVLHAASSHDPAAATATELLHDELVAPFLPVTVLPAATATARDVLRVFIDAPGLVPSHVVLASEGGVLPGSATRTVSHVEALRFVNGHLRADRAAPRPVRPTPHVSVHDDELLISTIRVLALRRADRVSVLSGAAIVGEVSLRLLNAAGLAGVTAAQKQTVGAFVATHKTLPVNLSNLHLLTK